MAAEPSPSPAETLRQAGSHMRRRSTETVADLPAPPMLAPLGDLLMAIADEMADYPAVHVPNGIGIESRPNAPSAIWTTAYRVASSYLDRRPQ